MLIKNLISFKYHEWEIFEGEDFTNAIPARKLGGSGNDVVKLMNLYIIMIIQNFLYYAPNFNDHSKRY